MDANLIVFDIGSTWTKAVAFRLDGRKLTYLARGQATTTVKDVALGAAQAEWDIQNQGVGLEEGYKRYSSCSAAGGLRMVAMGYMPKVTAKAAKEVAMTAGARVMEVISVDEPPEFREEVLHEIRPDIILLAGGTDNGDETSALENAAIICRAKVTATVIVACNQVAQRRVVRLLKEAGIPSIRIPNIIPTIHELNTVPAREAIHSQFIKQITQAQGVQEFCKTLSNQEVIPTPGAVFFASELLAKGIYGKEGIGSLMLIDIGGATTDIHSAIPELLELKIEERGLLINNEKQYSYRTVEGNLGMRISAGGVLDTVGAENLLTYAGPGVGESDIIDYIEMVEEQPDHIPQSEKEKAMDHAIATCAINLSIRRHAGFYAKENDAVMGVMAGTAMGRDLRHIKNIVCSGGVLVNAADEEKRAIITHAFEHPGNALLPIQAPRLIYDEHYLLFALGVLSKWYPEAVLDFMLEEWKNIEHEEINQ
ncbi:MAG: glutamate mutase L [Eubacterium aggregans]|uniref:glutamate mutase L n=1 Tax=Eubacterium aggregans TaxID=81409 RepID=UPI002B2074AC|nr:glutamate mutase L [Eubacterium aggregans]MEA5073527.1 glutamate mutase L [Eubacterium aggregans]